ncbi:MAG: PfkB family carbohydrate kinase, partial [Deltaproteobacteria bacterium]
SIITCGEWGMVSVSQGENKLNRIPTFAREVYDVTGAGDTVIAVLSLMYVLKNSLSTCMQVANAAAGIVVGHIGAACVTPQELKSELERLSQAGLIS